MCNLICFNVFYLVNKDFYLSRLKHWISCGVFFFFYHDAFVFFVFLLHFIFHSQLAPIVWFDVLYSICSLLHLHIYFSSHQFPRPNFSILAFFPDRSGIHFIFLYAAFVA